MPALGFVVRNGVPLVDCDFEVVTAYLTDPGRIDEVTVEKRDQLLATISAVADTAASAATPMVAAVGDELHAIRECLDRGLNGPAVVSAWSVVDEVLLRQRRIVRNGALGQARRRRARRVPGR